MLHNLKTGTNRYSLQRRRRKLNKFNTDENSQFVTNVPRKK